MNLSWPRKSAFSLENYWVSYTHAQEHFRRNRKWSSAHVRMRKSTSGGTGRGRVCMRACVKALPAEPEVVECACAEIKHELQSVSLNRNNKRSECVCALVITMNKNIILLLLHLPQMMTLFNQGFR